jgi:hypothetical protein
MFSPTDYFAIIAKKKHGKTTLGCSIDRAFPRIIVFDRMSEDVYSQRARAGDPCTAIAEGLSQFKRGIEWSINRPRFELIYRFPDRHGKARRRIHGRALAAYKRGSVMIKIEEIWFCATPHYMPPALEDIAFTGRHRGLSICWTTQLPAQVNKKLLGMCEHRFYGLITEANALGYLREELGEHAEKLKTLPRGNFLWSRDEAPPEVIKNK